MQSMRARKISKVLTHYMVLALLLPVWICIRFAGLKGALRSQSNLFYRLIHLFTDHSTNTYWMISLDQKGRETCLRIVTVEQRPTSKLSTLATASHKCKTFWIFFAFATKKQCTSSQSLRFFSILVSMCVHASKATLQLPSFPVSVQDRKENLSFNMSPFHFDKHWFIL